MSSCWAPNGSAQSNRPFHVRYERQAMKSTKITFPALQFLMLIVMTCLLPAVLGAESEYCSIKRHECEERCNGLRLVYDCNDHNGARSVACSCDSASSAAGGSVASAISGGGRVKATRTAATVKAHGSVTLQAILKLQPVLTDR